MAIKGVHHVAYRCNNSQETVDFYTKVMGMKFAMAMSEDKVPSTHEPDPYMHIFFEAGPGSYMAFFELPNSPKMGRDENTPDWVQHIAFEVESMDDLLAAKERWESHGLDVVGVTDHTLFKSIYCFDPNGHRLELSCNVGDKELWDRTTSIAEDMLKEWNETGQAPKVGAWIHEKEFAE